MLAGSVFLGYYSDLRGHKIALYTKNPLFNTEFQSLIYVAIEWNRILCIRMR